ncbi:MAG: FkbM family methyltransferase [Methylococcales bacterium]|nr:FkbM family methyltransferase [Methylococcales bacterium]
MFLTSYPQLTLDSLGTTASCLNKVEARYLYDHDIPNYFRHGVTVSAGDTVFDVGANIGLFALSAYRQCDGDVRVFAFEPIPPIFKVLRLNAERYDPDKLKTFSIGLSREQKTLRFSYFPRLPSWSSAYVDRSNLQLARTRFKLSLLADIEAGRLLPWLQRAPLSIRLFVLDAVVKWLSKIRNFNCDVRTLSNIIREQRIDRIDLLKVDVEGGELDVLMGIDDHDWQKIRQVVLEVEHFSERSQGVVALLAKQGFSRIKSEQLGDAQRATDIGMIYAIASG